MTPVPGGTPATVFLGGEVFVVVGRRVVVHAAMAILFGQIGHGEDEDAAGVVGGDVVVDVGGSNSRFRCAGNVLFNRTAADDDVLGLADVDAGIRGDGLAVLDDHVVLGDRVNPIAAVGLLGTASPLGADVSKDDAPRPLNLDRVALGVLDEVLKGDVFLAGDEEPFATGSLSLVLEAEERLVRALSADNDVADIEQVWPGNRTGPRRTR